MRVYIVKYETLENGYSIEGFTNKKNAVSRVSKLKRDDRKKHKDRRRIDYVGLTKEPKIVTKDFDISRNGIINAINYI
tara:strand:+ start:1205 stop:1438 length:234 start_codon:yes stop_codon:yes gene_type:complete